MERNQKPAISATSVPNRFSQNDESITLPIKKQTFLMTF